MTETPADSGPVGPDDAPEVVEAFVAATLTAFQELTATPVTPRGPVRLCTTPAAGDVRARVDLRRPRPGRLVCTFPLAVLESLARRYLPAGAALTADVVDDCAGEFANVIAGQAKTMLKGTPYHFALSIPAVSRGQPPAADAEPGRGHWLLLFDSDVGGFGVQVELPPCR